MREDRLRNISLCAALAAVRSAFATVQDKLAPFFEAISLFTIILLTFGAFGLPAQGQLNLSPSTLNFGTVSVGASRAISIALTNSGTSKIVFSGERQDGVAFNLAR